MPLHTPLYRYPYSHHIDTSRNEILGSKTTSQVGNASWCLEPSPHQLNSSFRFAIFFFFPQTIAGLFTDLRVCAH